MPQTYIFVYQTICEANGKSYIGVRKTRYLTDGYIGCGVYSQNTARKDTPFHRAVKKYGYSSFRRYILAFFDTYEEALEEEAYLVTPEWISSTSNYNVAIGGKGATCIGLDEEKKKEWKRKLSKAIKQSRTPELIELIRSKTIGRKRSDEARKRMSESRKGTKQSPETIEKRRLAAIGRVVSEETKRKISEAHKGKIVSEEARRKMSMNNAKTGTGKKLSPADINRLITARHANPITEETRRKMSEAHKGQVSAQRKAVLQYDKSGNFIAEYESLAAAANELGCLRTAISNNLVGKTRSCNGFTFKYKEVPFDSRFL
jgi:group I intron endonuclease